MVSMIRDVELVELLAWVKEEIHCCFCSQLNWIIYRTWRNMAYH
jgi:hypothetical protein